jgi:hypothetical protein
VQFNWDDELDQVDIGVILKHCMMAVAPMKALSVDARRMPTWRALTLVC